VRRHGERRSEEDRAVDAVARRPEIGDGLRDTLKNPAGFLGSAPEKRWVGVLAVKIDHDRKGFMEREIAVADGGHVAERINGQKLRSLKLALRRFEKLPFVGNALHFRGEQNPPSKGAPRDPIDFPTGDANWDMRRSSVLFGPPRARPRRFFGNKIVGNWTDLP
jgi:hypothetical protein